MPSAQGRAADRSAALRSVGLSLFVNALCPFVVYRVLAPRYPANSITPLLYATIFPIVGLISGLIRKRALEFIAIFAMAGITIHVVATLLARDVAIALVLRSLDGSIIGLALIISALIGRPILLLVAQQAAAGRGSEQAVSLERFIQRDGARTFFTVTMVWGVCLMAMSGLHVLLALRLAPATFLLTSPVVGLVTIGVLLAWTGRYVATRARTDSS